MKTCAYCDREAGYIVQEDIDYEDGLTIQEDVDGPRRPECCAVRSRCSPGGAMTAAAGRRRKPQCTASVFLVLDKLDCYLPEWHTGLHQHVTEDGDRISWRLAERNVR